MWGLDTLGIQVTDTAVTAPFWLAAVLAGLLFILLALSMVRAGAAGTLAFVALVAFGVWFAWSWLDHQRSEDRRLADARLAQLEVQAAAPGSALACLDHTGGETFEQACERAVFASAENSAAALSFTAARLGALSEAQHAARAKGQPLSATAGRTQRALEQDAFGTLAQVLAQRGCTAEKCDEFVVLRDATKVRANLRARTFETLVGRYAPNWQARSNRAGAPAPSTVAAGTPIGPQYTLPSADSIPPVSIMNAEPGPAERREAEAPRPRPAPAREPSAPRRSASQLNTPLSPAPSFTLPSPPPSGPGGLY